MRILYLTGTRSDYGLMRRTLLACNKSHQLSLIVTGTHLHKTYGLTVRVIKRDGLAIWKTISLPHAQKSVADMAANRRYLERKLDECITPGMFDLCFIEGDRYEALAMARVAHRKGIVIVHQGGGDRSGSIDDAMRDKITSYADMHLAGSTRSAQRLQGLGIASERIYMFGEPGLDDIAARDFTSRALIQKRYAVDHKKKLLLCIMHPDTMSRISPKRQIGPVLSAIEQSGMPAILIYPNGDAGSGEMIREIEKMRGKPHIQIYPSLSRADFLGLLNRCDIFIGNSSAGLIETTLVNVPSLCIGNRQKGRLADKNAVFVPLDTSRIIAAVKKNIDKKGTFKLGYVYGRGRFTKHCMKLLNAYERNR